MIVDSELLQQLSDEFSDLTEQRHQMGAEQYGPAKFLTVDTIEMAAEELVDLSNYARYLYIKLRIIEESLRERGIDLSASLAEEAGSQDPVSFGAPSFVPSSKVSGFLPIKEQR